MQSGPARHMDNNDSVASMPEGEAAEIAAVLATWYADHPSIRRLWAIADSIGLKVVVALEPTFDGDDALPVWLANSRIWADDLRLRFRRELRLRVVGSSTLEESYIGAGAVRIAEVDWRDP